MPRRARWLIARACCLDRFDGRLNRAKMEIDIAGEPQQRSNRPSVTRLRARAAPPSRCLRRNGRRCPGVPRASRMSLQELVGHLRPGPDALIVASPPQLLDLASHDPRRPRAVPSPTGPRIHGCRILTANSHAKRLGLILDPVGVLIRL